MPMTLSVASKTFFTWSIKKQLGMSICTPGKLVFSLTKFYIGIFYWLKQQSKMMVLDCFRQSVLSFYLRAYINSYNWCPTYKRELRKMAQVVNNSKLYLKQIMTTTLSSFPIHRSLIILPSDTIESELLMPSLNKPQINTYEWN
jgi:hypothetical protein